jgi:predicted neuraminidase
MQKHLTSIVFTVLIVLLGLSAWMGDYSDALSWRFVAPYTSYVDHLQKPRITRGYVFEEGQTASVHAPALAELSDGSIMSVWYGGTREGSADVSLYASVLAAGDDAWSPPRELISRQELADGLGMHIRKLGNAVLLSDGEQKLWLFFVSTSVGGWSTSAINMMVSQDDGRTWRKPVRIVASPFLNVSTLVKGHPFFYQDGTIGLPVYHELMGKFAELLRVDSNGAVLDKQRMTHRRDAIQPDIALLENNRMHAVLRNTGASRVVLQQSSSDGGKTWSLLNETSLPNPDAAVTVASVRNAMAMVYNDSSDDRDRMALALSTNRGKSWHKIYQLEQGGMDEDGNKDEFSYPYLIRTRKGDYHLVYTWKRRRIAHVSFNDAWIGRQAQ